MDRPGRGSHPLACFELHARPTPVGYSGSDPDGGRPHHHRGIASAQVAALGGCFRPISELGRAALSPERYVVLIHSFVGQPTLRLEMGATVLC
jgi:hypothetical protein